MKKCISCLMIVILLVFAEMLCMAEGDNDTELAVIDGQLTFSCFVDAPVGTPVSVFIMPRVLSGGEDVTVESVNMVNTTDAFGLLNIDYMSVIKVSDNNRIELYCNMNETLPTGICHIILNHINSNGAYVAASFEHVSKNDISELVNAFNASEQTKYKEIILADCNGENDAPAKEILRKSSANVEYYKTLADTSEFDKKLFGFKPVSGFTINSLIQYFNETVAWIRLYTEEDILSVIKEYNGKFWDIDCGENSDFAFLSDSEQTIVLENIKISKYEEKEKFKEGFLKEIALSIFRTVNTREELKELISEENEYTVCFKKIRDIVSEAKLSEYKLSIVYNKVLENNSSCKSFEEAETIFKNALQFKTSTGGSSGGASGGISLGASSSAYNLGTDIVNKNLQDIPSRKGELPFSDVLSNDWAYSYIKRLYENGIVNGIDNDTFNPDDAVSRQDFIKILVGALEIKVTDNQSPFYDVVGSYSEPYISAAYENGLINGISETEFGAQNNILREDVAVIISRVLDVHNMKFEKSNYEYHDSGDFSEYARDAICTVTEASIFNGDETGNFNPKSNLSRAEACAVLCRLADMIKEE